MFCEACGHALADDAKFCSACGRPVTGGGSATLPYAATAADQIPSDDPILVLRPVFVGWATVTTVLPIQLFMTVWAGGFCGGFSQLGLKAISKATGVTLPNSYPFIFWACAAFFGIPLATYYFKKRSYARSEYRFYRDRLEYYQGSFTIQQKTIEYRFVQEVNLTKGVFQRAYNLGTIVLNTPSSTSDRTNLRGGVRVADVENPDAVYEQVKELVHKAVTAK